MFVSYPCAHVRHPGLNERKMEPDADNKEEIKKNGLELIYLMCLYERQEQMTMSLI